MRPTIFNGKDVNTGKLLYWPLVSHCISLSKNGDKKRVTERNGVEEEEEEGGGGERRGNGHVTTYTIHVVLWGVVPTSFSYVGVDVWSGDWRVPRRWTQKQTTWLRSQLMYYIYIYIYMYFVSCPKVFLEILKMAHVSNLHVGTGHVLLQYWMHPSYSSCARETHPLNYTTYRLQSPIENHTHLIRPFHFSF